MGTVLGARVRGQTCLWSITVWALPSAGLVSEQAHMRPGRASMRASAERDRDYTGSAPIGQVDAPPAAWGESARSHGVPCYYTVQDPCSLQSA